MRVEGLRVEGSGCRVSGPEGVVVPQLALHPVHHHPHHLPETGQQLTVYSAAAVRITEREWVGGWEGGCVCVCVCVCVCEGDREVGCVWGELLQE